MTCKYAYQAALDDIMKFLNEEHEAASKGKKLTNSDHTVWWRLQGEQDFILKMFDKVARLMRDS